MVSFDPSQLESQASPEMIAKWAYQIAWFMVPDIQVIYGVHEDTDIYHVHFVINTVVVDGKMYTSRLGKSRNYIII